MYPINLIIKGIKNPSKIIPYMRGKIQPKWVKKDGYVLFKAEDGSAVGAASTRPEFSAILYSDARGLQSMLQKHSADTDRCLEIGCGYGRLTPWVSEHTDDLIAAEFNPEYLSDATTHFPNIDFLASSVTHLPFPKNTFDMVFSWAVLGHIPPKNIRNASNEINRVLTDDGVYITCEECHGEKKRITWSRTKPEYDELLTPLKLIDSEKREMASTESSDSCQIMVFR